MMSEPLNDPEFQDDYLASKKLLRYVVTDPSYPVPVDLHDRAEANGWHSVSFNLAYVEVTRALVTGQPTDAPTGRMIEVASRSGDRMLLAKGLAAQAYHEAAGEPNDDAERRLARAAALVVNSDGSPLIRPGSAIWCGLGYRTGQLWPLVVEMNRFALDALKHPLPEAFDETVRGSTVVASLHCALAQLAMACEAVELGEQDQQVELQRCCSTLTPDLIDRLPSRHKVEYLTIVNLLDTLHGHESSSAAPSLEELERVKAPDYTTGLTLVAEALLLWKRGRWVEAQPLAEQAVSRLRHRYLLSARSLALRLAAGNDPRAAGALRYCMTLAVHRAENERQYVEAARTRRRAEELRLANQQLNDQIHTDPLTGLANRRGLERYLGDLQADSGRRPIGVLLVDVDRFKQVNDTFGHDVGDAALDRIARILSQSVRSRDLAARTGGDEFVLVVRGATMSTARQRAGHIVDRVGAVYGDEIAEGLELSVSVGCAVGPVDTVEELIEAADRDMYRNKKARAEHRA